MIVKIESRICKFDSNVASLLADFVNLAESVDSLSELNCVLNHFLPKVEFEKYFIYGFDGDFLWLKQINPKTGHVFESRLLTVVS